MTKICARFCIQKLIFVYLVELLLTCVELKIIFIYYINEYTMKGDDIMALWKDIDICRLGTIFQSVDEANVFYCGHIHLTLASYAQWLNEREPSRELFSEYEAQARRQAYEYFEKRFEELI